VLTSIVIPTSFTINVVRKHFSPRGAQHVSGKRTILSVNLSKNALSNYIVPGTVLGHSSSLQSCELGTIFNPCFTGKENEALR